MLSPDNLFQKHQIKSQVISNDFEMIMHLHIAQGSIYYPIAK